MLLTAIGALDYLLTQRNGAITRHKIHRLAQQWTHDLPTNHRANRQRTTRNICTHIQDLGGTPVLGNGALLGPARSGVTPTRLRTARRRWSPAGGRRPRCPGPRTGRT
eukprot:scaffold86717_cov66-Phaeocystis_antarctica.AAC.1